jgi:hypothetical protein
MSQYAKEYAQFFESPAGVSLLTWLQDQRISEHDKAEANPTEAGYHVSTAKAYGDIQQHIDSVQTGVGKPGHSSSETDK